MAAAATEAFIEPIKHLDPPKGVLLLGVQGGGKSLAAKAVASLWGVPALRLDMGAIFNKYQGETERNMRDTLALADLCQPCVLWMDEIEKGLAQSEIDDAASKRILGTLLTWMSERKSSVFFVATSNDISKLPAELVRKGRFDEIFFVDLPELEVREMIARIHSRQQPLQDFDLQQIGLYSDGFSGAEIEQAIISAMYIARSESSQLNQQHIMQALSPASLWCDHAGRSSIYDTGLGGERCQRKCAR